MNAVDKPLEVFLKSVREGNSPPGRSKLLTAVWYGLRGSWNEAHDIAQADSTAEAAWIHAWLHRTEGDNSNARYWYARAQKNPSHGDSRTEGETIAAALLAFSRDPHQP